MSMTPSSAVTVAVLLATVLGAPSVAHAGERCRYDQTETLGDEAIYPVVDQLRTFGMPCTTARILADELVLRWEIVGGPPRRVWDEDTAYRCAYKAVRRRVPYARVKCARPRRAFTAVLYFP